MGGGGGKMVQGRRQGVAGELELRGRGGGGESDKCSISSRNLVLFSSQIVTTTE